MAKLLTVVVPIDEAYVPTPEFADTLARCVADAVRRELVVLLSEDTGAVGSVNVEIREV